MFLWKWYKKWRGFLLVEAVEWIKPWYARWFKKHQEAWDLSGAELLHFPVGTLGKRLGSFLKQNNFLLEPFYEDHDVFHVLLGFGPTVKEEAGMQFFLLGNGKRSVFVWITVLGAILLMPECQAYFRAQFRRGRDCLPVHTWEFQYLLREPVSVLQGQMTKRQKGMIPFIF